MKHLVILASLLLAASCGSKSKGGETADPCKDPCKDQPGATFDGPLEAGRWENLSHEEQESFMKQVVMPTMKKKFQDFDPEGYAEFNCATCHGAGASEGGEFQMPNADLPVLTMETFTAPPEEDKLVIEFMANSVKPVMAELLGMPERTETTAGFGCTECHTMAEQ